MPKHLGYYEKIYQVYYNLSLIFDNVIITITYE